jgi:hypothetical protein
MLQRFEHRTEPLLSRGAFTLRVVRYAGVACAMIAISLALGMAGYHQVERMAWIDAFLNAAMILGGMGPVDRLTTPAGKLFAGGYALFAGIIFLVATGVLLAPIIHRLQHRFHLDVDAQDQGDAG